jgi:hypothetical protein
LLILAAVLWENPLAGAFAKKSMERCTWEFQRMIVGWPRYLVLNLLPCVVIGQTPGGMTTTSYFFKQTKYPNGKPACW